MSYKSHFSKTLHLAFPVILSQLGHILTGTADSLMVGRLGEVPLAAAALANSLFFFFLIFGIGVSYGITPLVSASLGSKNYLSISKYGQHGIIQNIILGVILFLLVTGGSELLIYFDQEPEVVGMASPYLKVLGISIIPIMVFQSFRQYLEGFSLTKPAMYSSVTGNILNVFLNYLLIFGKFGFPALGLLGAGYATLIARIFISTSLMWWTLSYSTAGQHLKGPVKLVWSKFKELLNIGIPSGLQLLFEVGAFSMSAIMVGWISAEALAAHQIALNLSAITYMVATGLAAATTIRVGTEYGKNDYRAMKEAGRSSFILVSMVMFGFALMFLFGRNFLPTLYIKSELVIDYASTLLVIAAFYQISDGIQVVGLGSLRGISDVKLPMIFTLIAYWVIAIPSGYFFAFELDMKAIGVWLGLLLGLTISAVLQVVRFTLLSKNILVKAKSELAVH